MASLAGFRSCHRRGRDRAGLLRARMQPDDSAAITACEDVKRAVVKLDGRGEHAARNSEAVEIGEGVSPVGRAPTAFLPDGFNSPTHRDYQSHIVPSPNRATGSCFGV